MAERKARKERLKVESETQSNTPIVPKSDELLLTKQE
jgi:hypothetical protein